MRIEGGEILQAGASLVDVVRRVPPGATLLGRFVPPAGASTEQRFAVLLEAAGTRRPRAAFEWRGDLWSRLRGSRDF